MISLIASKISELGRHSLDVANKLVDRLARRISKAWNAHRSAMEANGAYRQAFYAGGTALLTAGSTHNLWMAVVGMLLSLYVAVFGPIKTSWTSRPLGYWEDDQPYERW